MNKLRVVRKVLSNGWSIEEILYQNGSSENRYFFLGQQAPLVMMLKDKLTSQYAGYTLIEKDLRSSLIWLNEIKEADSDLLTRYSDPKKMDLLKAYFVAAITFYRKCYTSSDGRKLKFERSYIPEEMREVHDLAMKIRHNFTAHSGDGYENAQVALVLHPTMKSDMKPSLYTELRQPDFIEPIDKFIVLVETMQKLALDKREIVGEKIMSNLVWPKGKLYWYTQAKYN